MRAPDHAPAYLTDSEIDGICEPLRSVAAMCRHLKRMGLMVVAKPNGRPLVARSEFERVLGAARMETTAKTPSTHGPNVSALVDHLTRKKHGTRT
ncbi:DUF4224 domain-containing protein [Acidovorax sp. LjRoot118]|uniref:DUF4224 domain-containing protein n=1 Tax=Acidovorax sp. LjRoot118 TaxID=3342256 RepID=UPI003ECC26A4